MSKSFKYHYFVSVGCAISSFIDCTDNSSFCFYNSSSLSFFDAVIIPCCIALIKLSIPNTTKENDNDNPLTPIVAYINLASICYCIAVFVCYCNYDCCRTGLACWNLAVCINRCYRRIWRRISNWVLNTWINSDWRSDCSWTLVVKRNIWNCNTVNFTLNNCYRDCFGLQYNTTNWTALCLNTCLSWCCRLCNNPLTRCMTLCVYMISNVCITTFTSIGCITLILTSRCCYYCSVAVFLKLCDCFCVAITTNNKNLSLCEKFL